MNDTQTLAYIDYRTSYRDHHILRPNKAHVRPVHSQILVKTQILPNPMHADCIYRRPSFGHIEYMPYAGLGGSRLSFGHIEYMLYAGLGGWPTLDVTYEHRDRVSFNKWSASTL